MTKIAPDQLNCETKKEQQEKSHTTTNSKNKKESKENNIGDLYVLASLGLFSLDKHTLLLLIFKDFTMEIHRLGY